MAGLRHGAVGPAERPGAGLIHRCRPGCRGSGARFETAVTPALGFFYRQRRRCTRGRSAAGSASPCQGEGRGFESRRPLGGASGPVGPPRIKFHGVFGHTERSEDPAEWPSGLGKGLQSPVRGFDSRLRLGRLAQWESASLTRKRSLVQSQYRPPPRKASASTTVLLRGTEQEHSTEGLSSRPARGSGPTATSTGRRRVRCGMGLRGGRRKRQRSGARRRPYPARKPMGRCGSLWQALRRSSLPGHPVRALRPVRHRSGRSRVHPRHVHELPVDWHCAERRRARRG